MGGNNGKIEPIKPYIQLTSTFIYGQTYTTGNNKSIIIGFLADFDRMGAESRSLLIAFQAVMIHHSECWYVIYTIANNNPHTIIYYYYLWGIKVVFGFIDTSNQEVFDMHLRKYNLIFYNYGYPFEKYLSNIFQLNSISDYVSFISYIYLTDHDDCCLLVLDTTNKFDGFNLYLLKLLDKFNIIMPHIYVNGTMYVEDILNVIMLSQPVKRHIILSLDIPHENGIIKILSDYLFERHFKLSILHHSYITYLDNITHFTYTDEIDYKDISFPFVTVNKPDNSFPSLCNVVNRYLDLIGTMSESQIYDTLMNDRVNFNEYHFAEKPIYIFNGKTNLIQRIPTTSSVFFKRAEYYFEMEMVKTHFTYIGLLFDNSDDVFDILVGLEISISKSYNNVFFIPIFYDNNNDIVEMMNQYINKTKIFIGVTSKLVPKELVLYIENNNALLYYLGKSFMISKSRNILSMNINMMSIVYTFIGFIKENCDSAIILLDEKYYKSKEMNEIIDEIKYHFIKIKSIYYIKEKKDSITSFINKILNLLIDKPTCIINLMNKWTYKFIRELDSRFVIFQYFKLLSFDVKISKELPKPTHFNHYLFQFNSVTRDNYRSVFIDPFYSFYQTNYLINDITVQSYICISLFFDVLKKTNLEDIYNFIEYHHNLQSYYIKYGNFSFKNNLLISDVMLHIDEGYNTITNQRSFFHVFKIVYLEMNQCPIRLNKKFIEKGQIIGLLLGLTGYFQYVNYQLLSAALIYMIADSRFAYEIINTKSTTEGCIEGLKVLINKGISYIIMGHGMYDCLIKSVDLLDNNSDKDLSVWYVENSPGYFCDSRYVFFGILPNAFLSSTLFYFMSISTFDKAYIFYDSTSDKSNKYYLNIDNLLSSYPIEYKVYSLPKTTKESIGEMLIKHYGIVFISHPTNNKLIEIISYLHGIKAQYNNIIYMVEQTEDELIYFKDNILEGFYLVDSTFSIIEIDEEYRCSIPSSTLLKSNITAEMSNLVTAASFIINGFQGSPKDTINLCYEIGFYSYEGKINLQFNNYLNRNVKIVKIMQNNILTLVYESYGISPDPFYYSTNSVEICNFYDDIFMERIYNIVLIDYQYEKVFIDFVYFFYTSIISNEFIIYWMYYRVYVVSSNDECRNYFQYVADSESISMLFIINIDVCSDKLFNDYSNINKTVWLLSNYPNDIHEYNTFYSGLPITHIIRPILLHLITYKHRIPIAFIIKPKWINYYTFIEKLLPEYNLQLIFKLYSTSKTEIYESVKHLIKIYPKGIHLFIEQDRIILENIIHQVNLLSNNNTNGLYDYLSFIESPNYFINDPNYIRIGTYLHKLDNIELFDYELNRRFINEDGYASIYLGLNTIQKLNNDIFNDIHTYEITKYKTVVYNKIFKAKEGELNVDINNNIKRRLEVSYYKSSEYKEYKLGFTNVLINTYTSTQSNIEITDCRLNKCNKRIIKTIKIALIIPKCNCSDDVYSTMIAPFLLIHKYFETNYFFDNMSYMIYPFISEYNNTITLTKHIENMKKTINISLIITNLDYIFNIGNIHNINEMIIFNLGKGIDEYVSPIYTIGPSLVSMSNEIYLSIMQNRRNEIYILYSKSIIISTRITENFNTIFLGSGFNIHFINYEEDINNSTFITLMNCYKSSDCSFINTIPCSMTIELYNNIMKIIDEKEQLWNVYTLFQDISTDYYYDCYLPSSYYVSGYVSMLLHQVNITVAKNTTQNFYDFIMTYFDDSWNKNSEVSYAYDAILIYLSSIEKIDNFYSTQIKANMLFREYNSASGITSFKEKNQLSRNIFFGQIISPYNATIIHYSSLYASSPSLQPSSDKKYIYIGLLLDTKGGNEEELSRQIVLYSDTILTYVNEKESSNNITYIIRRYSLYRNYNTDIKTIKEILEEKKIIVVIGCTSFYCFNLYRQYYTPNKNKIFYPLIIPSEELCDRYIIPLRQNVVNKVVELFKGVNDSSLRSFIFVYDNYSQNIIQSMHISVLPNTSYYLYPFQNITMKQFLKIVNGKSIMNFITSEYLKAFEKEYLLYRNNNLNFESQLLFYFDEYQIGFDILKQLNSHYIASSFQYDGSSTNTNTFNKYLNTQLGLDFYISQTMMTYDGVFSVVVNSYNLAFSQMIKEEADDSSLIDYLQIASQELAQSYLIGDLQGTKTNSFVEHFYLSEINIDGSITRSFVFGDILDPFEYNPKFKNLCNVSKKEKPYEFSKILYVSVNIISVLITIIFFISWFFLERYKTSHIFKYNEVTILRYLLLSGYISVIPSLYLNYKYNKDIWCEISIVYILITLYNFFFLLLNQIKWLGCYYGIVKKKTKYTSSSVIKRTLYMDSFIIILNVAFRLITPISSFTKNENKDKSNYITMYYYPQCYVNTVYVVINVFLLVLLFFYVFIYLYQLKVIRTEFSRSSHLTRAIALCVFMVILFLMFEILISDFTELTYIVEEMCIIIYSIGCNCLILLPKLLYIHFHEMSSGNTDSSKTISTTITNDVNKNNNRINGEIECKKEDVVRKAELSTIIGSENDNTQNEY